jgi:hypothetical protein
LLSEDYTQAAGLMRFAIRKNRQISGFDGSQSQSYFEIDLRLEESNPLPHCFIITKLKDSYNGILGMPWMRTHRHSIDWAYLRFRPNLNQTSVATTAVVLSSLPNTPPGLMGNAGMIDKGVCVLDTMTPLQCEIDPPSMNPDHETAGKHTPFLDFQQHRTPHGTMAPGPIATAKAVLSSPPHTLLGPMGTARMIDKGVRAISVITPPQCELATTTTSKTLETGGKLAFHLNLIPHRTTGVTGRGGNIATAGAVL